MPTLFTARITARPQARTMILFAVMAGLLLATAFLQSWSVAFAILNLCLISALMSLGVNIQWGYAGLFNVGVMGFAALGGLAAVIISHPPINDAWQVGGGRVALSLAIILAIAVLMGLSGRYLRGASRLARLAVWIGLATCGYMVLRLVLAPAAQEIEAVNPSLTGFLGGLGLPILWAWPAGGVLAAAAAYVIGKVTLGLRSDYLAIATLGISEIIISFLKNEEWLSRGVKNVTGLPRPVPYEIDLQQALWFNDLAQIFGGDANTAAGVFVKIAYMLLFLAVLGVILYLSEAALRSPWGRMMRAVRDNEEAAEAMGKDVKARHLQVFILGSAVIGIAGAMLVTLDGQFTPSAYQPLRFTFLIWVMVIVGGSGNNYGAILGGFIVWFFWVTAEPLSFFVIDFVTGFLAETSPLRLHLLNNAGQLRLVFMGGLLLAVLRFAPFGLLPERK